MPGSLSFAQVTKPRTVDSLLQKLRLEQKDTNTVNLLDQLSYAYSRTNPDSGIYYGGLALKLSEDIGWKTGIAKSLLDLGINHKAKAAFARSLEYSLRALTYSESACNQRVTAATYSNIGLVYLQQGEYAKMIEYGLKALRLYETLGDKRRTAITLENLGTGHFRQKAYVKTSEYYNRALKIYTELGDRTDIARALGNMGMVLDAQQRYPEALNYHLKALDVNKKLGNQHTTHINLANIGLVYYHKGNYQQAVTYHRLALEASRKLQDPSSVAINLGNLGEAYYAMATSAGAETSSDAVRQRKEHLAEAIRLLEQATDICRSIEFNGPLIEFSQVLAEVYYKAGENRKAFNLLKAASTLKDSVFSSENQVLIANLEATHIAEQKTRELAIKELTIAQKQNEKIILVISIALLALILGTILRGYFHFRKSHRKLLHERHKQLEVIEDQIRSMKQLSDTLKEISYIQAHDVRGPVATILGLTQVFNYQDYTDPDNKIVIDGIATVAEELDVAVKEVIRKEPAQPIEP